eukprot:gene1409-12029_t
MSIEKLSNVKATILPESKKIVILFGWSGSTHKLLSKYAEIYQERLMSTIQLTAIMQMDRDAPNVLPLLKAIDEDFQLKETFEDYSIHFHVMSNGGLFNYMKALHFIQSTDGFKHWQPLIKGVVFDSTPGDFHITTYATVLTTYMKNIVLKTILWYLIVFLMLFWTLFSLCFERLRLSADKIFVQPITNGTLHDTVPLLIIYSQKDHLIEYTFVESYISKLKKAGKLVTSKFFKESEHNTWKY